MGMVKAHRRNGFSKAKGRRVKGAKIIRIERVRNVVLNKGMVKEWPGVYALASMGFIAGVLTIELERMGNRLPWE